LVAAGRPVHQAVHQPGDRDHTLFASPSRLRRPRRSHDSGAARRHVPRLGGTSERREPLPDERLGECFFRDHAGQFTASFDAVLAEAGIEVVKIRRGVRGRNASPNAWRWRFRPISPTAEPAAATPLRQLRLVTHW